MVGEPPVLRDKDAWASHSAMQEAQMGEEDEDGGVREQAMCGHRGLPARRASRDRRPVMAWAVETSPCSVR